MTAETHEAANDHAGGCSPTASALAKLEGIHAPPSAGQKTHRRLPLSSVKVDLDAFQVRGGDFDDAHVAKLSRTLDSVDDLTPILVLPCKDRFIVIDGHHRRKAYQLSKRSSIPAVLFAGTVREAALEAVKLNTQATLQMDNRQRGDCAWRLVLLGHFSKPQIVSASGVSAGQVAIMRRTAAKLGAEAFGIAQWGRARWLAAERGEPLDDDEREDWKKRQAQDWADRLPKVFGSKLTENPEVAAMAFAIHFGRKRWELALFTREQLNETELDQLHAEENPEDDIERFY
jgi:ParB-like chromosome segregation protein Spo0J